MHFSEENPAPLLQNHFGANQTSTRLKVFFTPEHFFMRAEHPCTALHINETPTHNTVILKMFAFANVRVFADTGIDEL